MSGLLPTAVAPLFERLCADADAAPATLDTVGLLASIAREIDRLFNTRSHLTFDQFSASAGGVLDYGLPDHSALSPSSGDDLERLRLAVTQALTRYEPRLVEPRVSVHDWPGRSQRTRIRIDANVRLGLAMRRVEFDLAVDPARIRTGLAGEVA